MKQHCSSVSLITLALIAALVNGCDTPVPTQPLAPSLALINGVLIDGTGAEPVLGGALVIEDGRIVAVGPRDEVSIPPDARVIDVQGGTILPGLVNAHVHRAFETANLVIWAQAGVTTVRDLGTWIQRYRSWNDWMDEASAGRDLPTPYPFSLARAYLSVTRNARIVASGPLLTVPDGYPIHAFPWGADLALTVTSPEDARRRTGWLLDNGAAVIKIVLFGEQGLSLQEVDAIVALAHQRGTPVSAHVDAAHDLALGAEAGIDDAAHMVPEHLSDEIIAQLVARGLYIVPTLAVLEAYGSLGSGIDNLRRFVAAGGRVALGDDYGNPGILIGMPIRDMELMQESGMEPMQIIVAGTQNGAHVCNLGDQLGTLEVGKIADVLVVGGNPLEDIHVLTNAQWVIRDGVLVRSPGG
jgi:imidazolonepropionase-like amidohydrolase